MAMIDRTGAEALIPEDVVREIFKSATEESATMRLMRRLPNMSAKQQRLPVLSALPTAGWVDGDVGLKATSKVEWANKYINAEVLAVIVPIPEEVLDDAAYNITEEVRPLIAEAIGKAWDEAVLFGTNAPSTFPTDIVAGAVAASNSVVAGTGADLYDDILGASGVISLVEADGYLPTGHIAALSMRGRLRGIRASTGELIFTRDMQTGGQYALDGEPILFPRNGSFDATQALLVSGDWKQAVYAVRKDVTTKVLDQAALFDSSGNLMYSLPQQDMIAIRVVFRGGWQLPNPINRINATEATRYPFAVLTP